ncbi:MAG: hypothetical protein FJ290_14770 [Planctomycetes bacterium]|nr:hypothetical protein [Planctomycetota bacterium]
MSKNQRIVLIVAAAAAALSLLWPPWVCWVSKPTVALHGGFELPGFELGGERAEALRYRFIFDGPQEGDWPAVDRGTRAQPWSRGAYIDGGRLLVQLGAILVGAALAYFLAGQRPAGSSVVKKERSAELENVPPAITPIRGKRSPVAQPSGRRWQL